MRKSQFKDLAMKGKNVLLSKQDVDCLMALPMEIEIDADANVRLSLRGASGTVPFGENIHPTALKSGLLNGLLPHRRLRHVQLGPDRLPGTSRCRRPARGPTPSRSTWSASSGVAWAPAVMWMSTLYEVFGRLFQMRGFVEEMAAGAATTMTAEFAGVNQYGHYLAGLTLEQASNGSPARGFADGENSAWCIYTPNADFGNAEVTELYYPILYLGPEHRAGLGGYGRFRGGLGHTAVWMVNNTPRASSTSAADAGMRSKVAGEPRHVRRLPELPETGRATRTTPMSRS